MRYPNPIINVDINGITSGEDLVDRIISEASPEMNHYTKVMKDPADGKKLILYDWRVDQDAQPALGMGICKAGYISTTVAKTGKSDISIQAGANESQSMSFDLPNVESAELGVQGLYAMDPDNAGYAITTTDRAIETVSGMRSRLGAMQNRMEHAIANADNTAENVTASESRIRDVNMAEAMVDFSKENILIQTGQSMLAQANQGPQRILELLQ